MRAENIKAKGIKFLNILNCEIQKKVNHHGIAKIVGIIEEDYEETCISLAAKQEYIQIFAEQFDGKSKCIFVGYITGLEIDVKGIKKATVELVTGSNRMDLKKRTRTFQNKDMTYKQLLESNEKLNSNIGSKSIFLENGNAEIQDLVVQFKESDWEFAKRMAAKNHTFIRPAFAHEGAKYFWGLNTNQTPKDISKYVHDYKMKNRVLEYEKMREKLGLKDKDMVSYYFSSRKIYELGDCVKIGENILYVYNIASCYKGEEMVNKYEVRTKNGFKKMSYPNNKIIGASLEGSVLSAEKDKVKIKLDIDEKYLDHGEKYFLYSTVYSSPDGTGWYCMPEKGDCIRLYFPSEREKDAYAISAVHLSVTNTVIYEEDDDEEDIPRENPNYKTFSNSAGKKIVFKPDCLIIKNPAVGKIVLSDTEGITIDSKKSIRFKAQDFVEIHSTYSKVKIKADTDITMEQGENAKISLKNNAYVKGLQVHIQK